MEDYLIIEIDARFDSDRITSLDFILDVRTAIVKYNNLVKLSKEDYIPKIGDKLYFLPGVNIPRVKLKELTLNYNIKVVRNVVEATAIFGGKNSEGRMANSDWYYGVSVDSFKNCLEAFENILDDRTKNKLKDALEFYNQPKVYMKWSSITFLGREDLIEYKKMIVNPGRVINSSRSSEYLNLLDKDYYDLALNLKNRVILDEAGIVDKINGDDAIVIDAEVYDQLKNMFESSDTDNHVLAMEIMANSNYKESLLYLGILFKEFYSQIGASNTKNHVNFKSLLVYLNKGKYNLVGTVDNIIESLIEKDVLTIDKLNTLLDLYKTEILEYGDTDYFKIKSISITDELLVNLNHNYQYNIIPDFVPVVKENPEVSGEISSTEEEPLWL